MIDVVEAAYDLPDPQVDDATWAGRVHGALHPLLDRGMGSGVFLSAPERPFAAVGAQGLLPRWPEAMRQLMTSAAAPCLLHPPRPACTASQGVGPEALAENPAIGPWKELGVADGVGLVADDGTGHIDRRAYPTVPTQTRLEFAKPIPVRPSPGPPRKKKPSPKDRAFSHVATSGADGTRRSGPNANDLPENSDDPPSSRPSQNTETSPASNADPEPSQSVETRRAELEGAIARLTRALLTAADAVIPSLVTERAEMRDELRRLNEASAGNVLRLDRRVPR